VKVALILIAPFLTQAPMLLERLIVRCVLLFVGGYRRWNFVPAIFSKRTGGCANYKKISTFPEFRKRDTQAAWNSVGAVTTTRQSLLTLPSRFDTRSRSEFSNAF
jgi:hypothetical protein